MDAIYARQSVDKKDSVSIEGQIDLCRKECEGEPLIFQDKGFSGKNIDRPAFKALMQAVERGKIDKVTVYRLDRISRSISDFGRIWDIFKANNVEFVSVNEKFDTSSPVGRAMIYIIMVFAQLERETITQRITDSYHYRSSQGAFMGGNKPIGYNSKRISINGKGVSVLEIDSVLSQVVKDIFKWYLIGYNSHQIAHKLNENGTLTNSVSLWTRKKVIRVLKNVSYSSNDIEIYYYLKSKGYNILNPIDDFNGQYGMLCFFKNKDKNVATEISEQLVCIGLHEPIISASDWISVQKRVEEVKNEPNQAKRSMKSWIAGLIKCDVCGYSFGLRSTGKDTRKYDYYRCSCRSMSGAKMCNNKNWIPAYEVESLVQNELISRAKYLIKSYKPAAKQDNRQTISLHKQIDDFQSQINNLIDNIGKGNAITDKLFTERITLLDKKVSKFQVELESEISVNSSAESILSICKNVKNDFINYSVEDKNKSAKMLIEKVVVDIDGNIKVHFEK